MSKNIFQFGQSEWWLLLVLLISIAVGYFLYAKKNVPWSKTQNALLLGLRSLAIFCILLLLLDPSIRKVVNTIQKPIIAFAIDNSESILGRGSDEGEILNSISNLKSTVEDLDIDVEIFSLNGVVDSLQFDQRTTKLSYMLADIDEQMIDKNFVGTIVQSDGIYNRGISPTYRNYLTPIYTIGMGDTIPPKDISFSRVLYNRVAFKGNQTPIKLEISQEGYDNRNSIVSITENGKLIEEQSISLDRSVQEIEFLISSEDEGLRHLVASIPSDDEESTASNNQVDIFLEVIDGRQKILIIANAPHPDIKAIRSSLAETDNYTTEIFIPSITQEIPKAIYDVVIYHGAFAGEINYTPKENPGIWYFLNERSAISKVNEKLNYLNIQQRGGQPDKVTGSFNQNFSKYKLTNTEAFEDFPPVEVPFGEYQVSGASEVLMYQKLGSIVTRKPLMVIAEDGSNKSAIFIGQNIWRWKLQEAATNDVSTNFDNFISKTIQYLSVSNDKKQFRFNSRSKTFSDLSPLLFDVEVYNDIYERIYNNQIEITITNESGDSQKFNFIDSESNSTFRAPALDPGVYSYTAQVRVGDKRLSENGEFLVENVNPEYLNLTANHRLLKNLSAKTGGEFVHYNDISRVPDILRQKDFKSIIKSKEDRLDLIKSWWWYLIIFALFSTEWVLRRYWGSY